MKMMTLKKNLMILMLYEWLLYRALAQRYKDINFSFWHLFHMVDLLGSIGLKHFFTQSESCFQEYRPDAKVTKSIVPGQHLHHMKKG